MRRSSLFWGSAIVLLGIVLLVDQFVPGFNAWGVFWPLILIALGVWFLIGRNLARPASFETEQVSLPLDPIQSAHVRMHHGAGKLNVHTGSNATLMAGSFAGGLDRRYERQGDTAMLDLRPRTGTVDFAFPVVTINDGLTWDLALTPAIPLKLEVETGASETRLNLNDLKVSDLILKTGASSTQVWLPADAGKTRVEVHSGAASVELYVPQSAAARIHIQSGLAGISVDPNRFPATGNGYETPGFDTATNQIDISVETGVASITIR